MTKPATKFRGICFSFSPSPLKSFIIFFFTILSIQLSLKKTAGQVQPSLTGETKVSTRSVLFDQLDNQGTDLIISQNFEAVNEIYDCYAADDFAFLDETWSIGSIEVTGSYYSGSGPASSVNVWIYSSDGFGGLPVNIIYSALNIIPSAGLAGGSFTIDLPAPVVLTEGWYWLCVQANMDSSDGQWGWAGRTVQSFSESAWRNPGGGFETPCTPSWGYRITDCGVGTDPDNCFRINGDVIPVELSSFTAEVNENDVVLNWVTATESNNRGFVVERKQITESGGQRSEIWEMIEFIEGYGTSSEVHSYKFIDNNLEAGKYSYRLKQTDFDGSFHYSNIIEVEVIGPEGFLLKQNYPNPFNPVTSIQYAVSSRQFVSLKVYDILGNEVATLVYEYKPAGSYDVEFSINNEQLSSGIYFYRLTAGSYTAVKKMVYLK